MSGYATYQELSRTPEEQALQGWYPASGLSEFAGPKLSRFLKRAGGSSGRELETYSRFFAMQTQRTKRQNTNNRRNKSGNSGDESETGTPSTTEKRESPAEYDGLRPS
jgi:hypothetical protein